MNIIYDAHYEYTVSFDCSILTNEKGHRSYMYVMNMYEMHNSIHIPLQVCIISQINDNDAFRVILNEVYLIICSAYSSNAKKILLVNYLMFISSILIPPRHSILELHLHYTTVELYFHSQRELPIASIDTNITTLFNILDMNNIIKLWICVLQEHQIIIYGDKPFVLHAIIDSITKLIYPLEYPFPIISCLPPLHIDLLDVPTIYIMGVLSSCIDMNTLRKKYPDACIVDVQSGEVFAKKVKWLSREDEIALRMQIQYMKHMELYERDEMFKSERNIVKSDNVIDMDLSFSANIRRIFFNIMKQTLQTYKKYMKENKLDLKKYVESMDIDRRKFWGKVMESAIVDLFINEKNDNSSRRNFDEICKESSMQTKYRDSALRIEMKCPTVDIHFIINEIKKLNISDDISDIVHALECYHNEYVNEHNISLQSVNDSYNGMGIAKGNACFDLKSSPHMQSLKEDNFINENTTSKQHFTNAFSFYAHNTGFLDFINKYESLLSKANLHLNDIFFQKTFLTNLYEQTHPSHILTFKNESHNEMQKNLYYAFHYEEMYFNDNISYSFISNKNTLLDTIITLYHKAVSYDNIDFPYERYMHILSQLSNEQLNEFHNGKKIPYEVNGIFNEVLENSFAKIRANLPKIQFRKEQQSLSFIKKKSPLPKVKKRNIIFEGNSNKGVNFEKASKQLKQYFKKESHINKQKLQHYTKTSNNCSVYRFGISTDFSCSIILNHHKSKYQSVNPLSLILDISNSILSLMNILKCNNISIYTVCNLIEYKSTLETIKTSIDKLQYMNITKFTKAREKYCFWLNAFNFLVIYAIMYSGFCPQTFEQWDALLLNCVFDIGRYKYSLYQIFVCFLKCCNLHQSEIVLDGFLKKFLIKEDNVLINFCVYFPIQVDFFELKVYKEEIFEEQIYQTVLMFFKKNLKYDEELGEMVVSRYLENLFPNILEEDYKLFEIYIDNKVYKMLENKKCQYWRIREINWNVIDYSED